MSSIHSARNLSTSDFSTINREVSGQREIQGKPSYTVKQASDVLTRSGARWLDINEDGWTDVSYRMRDKPSVLFNAYGLKGFSPLGTAAQDGATAAMNAWSDVAKVRFTQAPPGGTEEGNIAFSQFTTNDGTYEGVAMTSGLASASSQRYVALNPKVPREGMTSDVFLDGLDPANTAPTGPNGGLRTYLHEVGHTLGLSHPHEPHPEGSSYQTASYAQDSVGYSVMSYWGEHHTGQNFNKNGVSHSASGPMVDDVAAIQKLYGPNTETRNGDTTYGFNATADRQDYRLNSASDAPVFTVWDGGGVDTLDFSGFADNQQINLNPVQPSNVGGMRGNVFIAKGVAIENAKGGTGNDIFIPNRVANVMTGGGGNNTYRYLSFKHSTPEKPDRITDFVSGKDKIDVSEMHRRVMKTAAGNSNEGSPEPSSAVVGPVKLVKQFSGRRNEAVLHYDSATKQARLEIDVKGRGNAGFLLLIDSNTPLKPTDIVLARPVTR